MLDGELKQLLINRALLVAESLYCQPDYFIMFVIVLSSTVACSVMLGHIGLDAGYCDLVWLCLCTGVTIYVISLYQWFVHYAGHVAARSDGAAYWAVAVAPLWQCHVLHHDPDPAISRSARAQALDVIAMLWGAGVPVLVLLTLAPCDVVAAARRILLPSVVIVMIVAFLSIHMVNYHGGTKSIHAAHHADPMTEISPNVIDLLTGTSTQVENARHMIPNAVAGAVVAAVACWLFSTRKTVSWTSRAAWTSCRTPRA
jgi:hypothetical protein